MSLSFHALEQEKAVQSLEKEKAASLPPVRERVTHHRLARVKAMPHHQGRARDLFLWNRNVKKSKSLSTRMSSEPGTRQASFSPRSTPSHSTTPTTASFSDTTATSLLTFQTATALALVSSALVSTHTCRKSTCSSHATASTTG